MACTRARADVLWSWGTESARTRDSTQVAARIIIVTKSVLNRPSGWCKSSALKDLRQTNVRQRCRTEPVSADVPRLANANQGRLGLIREALGALDAKNRRKAKRAGGAGRSFQLLDLHRPHKAVGQ